ncbi:MAG: response regulator [Deltaproteobacteria bacterium]|nr:response regulator [Deltaproteobacteria bacterium]
MNILLVDDRPDGLVTLEAVLSNPEYNLIKAGSGREALSALLDWEFAVIILDVQMPEMDGFETASLIKTREKSRTIPIIFVTAINKDPYFICKGYDVGAVDYLSKPFDPLILRSKVNVFVELFRKNLALKLQAERLQAAEEKNRVIIETARDIISTVSQDGIILSLSPAFEQVTGWHREDWIGKPFDGLVHPDDLNLAHEQLASTLTGKNALFETRIMNMAGGILTMETSAQLLVQNGERIGVIAVSRDISPRKEAERERKIRSELERSNTELEQFAHICSHDLQEPLRTMSSFAFLLKEKLEGYMDVETHEMITGLIDGASRMSFLIKDLLEYAHVGAEEIPVSSVDSLESLNQALKNLRQMIAIHNARIIHTDLPVVRANDALLVQVFQNLISNSIKFRGKAEPEITIAAHPDGADFVFELRDNGIGFKMEYAEKIFQVFKRLHNSSKYPGTGIGLCICKRVIERQGGRIWAQGELGKGASFFFTLPAPAGHALSPGLTHTFHESTSTQSPLM